MIQPIGPASTPTAWVARLASLVHALRSDWTEPGIRAALTKIADRPLIDVSAAAVAACRRLDQLTPAVIALDGPHWPTACDSQRTHAESGIITRCAHGLVGARCPTCHPRQPRGVPPTPEQHAEIRQAIADAKPTTPAKRHRTPPEGLPRPN